MNKYNRIQLLKHSSRLIANWRHEKVSAWLERKASVDLEGLRLVIFHNKYLFKTNSLVRRGPFIKIIDLAWIKKICYPFNKYNLLKVYFPHTKKKTLHSINASAFPPQSKLGVKNFHLSRVLAGKKNQWFLITNVHSGNFMIFRFTPAVCTIRIINKTRHKLI